MNMRGTSSLLLLIIIFYRYNALTKISTRVFAKVYELTLTLHLAQMSSL